VSRGRRILVAGVGLLLAVVATGEHLGRRLAERHYREALESRQQLEHRVGDVMRTHTQLTATLQREQQRSQALSEALASTRGQLEEAVGRLTEENKSVRLLQQRLASMQQQMDQLQGELAVTLEQRPRAASASASPVQLERIVVSDSAGATVRGRVLSVNQDWNFVVVDLGWNHVRIGDVISIFRNEQLLAKARIERVQEQVSVATLLPEWSTAKVEINDLARVL